MENQPSLFEKKEPSIGTLNAMVQEIMSDGNWRTPYELQRGIHAKGHEWVSDSTICARLRDLRKAKYGSHVIEIRKRIGTRSFEYRIG